MIIVRKSTKRKYGYELFSDIALSWVINGHSFGWYRYKKDAIKRAEELNKAV